MTIDEIIDLAQEAGIRITLDWAGRPYTTFIKDDGELYLRAPDALIHFAALVRAATLEEAAQICKDLDDEALAKESRLACGAECAGAIADLAAQMNLPFEKT